MRKASSNYGLIVIDGKFIGVSLGYDYCAEHEWGIKDMRLLFGIPDSSKKTMGIDSRSITICPDNLVFIEDNHKKQKCAILFTGYRYASNKNEMQELPHYLKDYKKDIEWNIKWNTEHPDREEKDPIITAWDSGSFGVAVMGDKEVEYLKELHQAFNDKNIVIASMNLSPNNPFSNASLSLLIKDRLPKEAVNQMYAADKEHYDLYDYEEEIGMKAIKEKYGNKNGYNGDKFFIACSPKWIDYHNAESREEQKKKYNTKYDIMYWINYSDNDNNCGWYTVEEIKKWLTTPELHLVEIRKG